MKPFSVEKNTQLFSSGHQQALCNWALRKPATALATKLEQPERWQQMGRGCEGGGADGKGHVAEDSAGGGGCRNFN